LWLGLFVGVLAGLGLARVGAGFGIVPAALVVPFLLMSLRRQTYLAVVLVMAFGSVWAGGGAQSTWAS